MRQNNTKIIGVTGGVGSGKTAVLEYLQQQYGAKIYLADNIAKQLLTPGEACYNQVREIFPPEVFTEGGEIHKAKMAEFIFHQPEYRQKQNDIVFPAVRKYIEEQIDVEKEVKTPIMVIEAALLIEEHYDEICDEMWYIYTNEENRRERLQKNRNYSDEKITAIINSQLPEKTFFQHADVVIDNNGSIEEAFKQIDKVMRQN